MKSARSKVSTCCCDQRVGTMRRAGKGIPQSPPRLGSKPPATSDASRFASHCRIGLWPAHAPETRAGRWTDRALNKRLRGRAGARLPLIRAAMLISLALVLGAQDLPPEVLLLSRIKRHLREELTHLPDYTCLETAQRQVRPAGAKGDLKLMDTVRLEVLYTGTHELYAAPGDLDFRENRPSAFTAGGLSASGLFGMFLHAIFINDLGTFTWRGEETLGGRTAVRYDYRVPGMLSGWNIHSGAVSGQVGMKGSIWADPDSLDLLRLKVQADDIPDTLDVSDATILIEYSRTRIGDASVLLPQSGELRLRHTTGAEGRNLMDYTHCRSFQAQSSLNFGEPVESSSAASSTAATSAPATSSPTTSTSTPIGLPP